MRGPCRDDIKNLITGNFYGLNQVPVLLYGKKPRNRVVIYWCLVQNSAGETRTSQFASLWKVWVIILTIVLVYLLSILAGAPILRYLVLISLQKIIWYEIQLVDELVVGYFEPPDVRAACDRICRHFAYGSYLLKLWWVKTHSYLFKKIHKCQTQHAPQMWFSGSRGPLDSGHER